MIQPIPFGFIPVHKPIGPTSHDEVAKLRRILPRKVKVGHTGTLDPFAEGLLVMAVGKATKFSDTVHQLDKCYEGTIQLGAETDSLDHTGTVTLESPIPDLDQPVLDQVAAKFIGRQQQVPPAFSAKKIEGKRGYDLARRGVQLQLKACEIMIHELYLALLSPDKILCRLRCGTGTYVRALARDIALALGTHGHLSTLKRTAVGPLTLEGVPSVADIGSDWGAYLRPISALLPSIPEIELPQEAFAAMINGQAYVTNGDLPPEFLGYYRCNSQVEAIFRCRARHGLVEPKGLYYRAP